LNILGSRREAINNKDLQAFVELSRMPSSANDKSGSKVKNICEIRNLPRNATDFAYDHKAGSLFLLISESGVVSKIGSFFSAFKNPSK